MNQESLDDLMILTFYSLVCWYLYLAFSPKWFALGWFLSLSILFSFI